MNNQRLAPWCAVSWDAQNVTFTRMRNLSVLYAFPALPFSASLQSRAQKDLPHLPWSQWYQQSQSMDEALEIKTLRNFLAEHFLVLDFVAAGLWSMAKPTTLAVPQVSEWHGFSRFVAIVADPDQGFWLEVPGATASLWSEDATVLADLLRAPPSSDVKKFLVAHGFDGRALSPELRQSSTVHDWLWWESTRMLERLGPLSHSSTQANPSFTIPPGTALELSAPVSVVDASRVSVREHDARRPLTHEQVLRLLAPVFSCTDGKVSPWHGMVHRTAGASGGGAWEESAWVWAHEVEGLAAGLYRFDGHQRCLVRYHLDDTRRAGWEHQAMRAWGRESAPHAVVAVVADFTKLPRKYFRLSQQLAHLNTGLRVGELLRTAESLGLASCALGGGVMKDLALQLELSPLLLGSVCEVAVGGVAQ